MRPGEGGLSGEICPQLQVGTRPGDRFGSILCHISRVIGEVVEEMHLAALCRLQITGECLLLPVTSPVGSTANAA
jgi:hypothetical protein